MIYLYKHWAKIGIYLAIALFVALFLSIHSISWPLFWVWIQLPIYLVHEFEEHAYPGNFKGFVNTEIFHHKGKDFPLNDANIFWINIPAVWILFPVVALIAQFVNPEIGLILPAFGLFNATLHILGFLAKRKYNPGLLASVLLNYPAGIYTLMLYSRHGWLTEATCSYALGLTLLIHLIIVIYAVRKNREKK
jgi:hypothetical protein